MAHVGGNPQRSDVAHPIYGIVPVSFDLSVRFRTALVLTPAPSAAIRRAWDCIAMSAANSRLRWAALS
ncbi:hypothetical protein F9K90_19960 [Brucella anthropi]|nr:hypothetical protein F9K90_19960 [Brucella anthropi]